MVSLLVISLLSALWWFRDPLVQLSGFSEPVPVVESSQFGYIKVVSDPEGAEVFDLEGRFLGITPLPNIELAAG